MHIITRQPLKCCFLDWFFSGRVGTKIDSQDRFTVHVHRRRPRIIVMTAISWFSSQHERGVASTRRHLSISELRNRPDVRKTYSKQLNMYHSWLRIRWLSVCFKLWHRAAKKNRRNTRNILDCALWSMWCILLAHYFLVYSSMTRWTLPFLIWSNRK